VLPPVAATVLEYDVPTVPEAKLDVAILKVVEVAWAAATDKVTVAVAVLLDFRPFAAVVESVTFTPKE